MTHSPLIYLRVTTSSASLLDIYFKLETNGQLSVKRDFNFSIPTAPAYGFNISQLILNARACRLYSDYFYSHRLLSTNRLSKRFLGNRLVFGRHQHLIEMYSFSKIVLEIRFGSKLTIASLFCLLILLYATKF